MTSADKFLGSYAKNETAQQFEERLHYFFNQIHEILDAHSSLMSNYSTPTEEAKAVQMYVQQANESLLGVLQALSNVHLPTVRALDRYDTIVTPVLGITTL